MRKLLLSISLLLCTFSFSYADNGFLPSADGERLEYSATIEMRGAAVSGICIVKRNGDEIVGSLVNEFGIKMMDFTCDIGCRRIRCRNVIKMMDKWYIRKVIKSDLRFLFSQSETVRNKRFDLTVDNDIRRLEDLRYGIAYTFAPIN